MKSVPSVLGLLLSAAVFGPAHAQDLVITGVVDGPLSGGVPKAIELCALGDIADLSAYGVGSANNGGGTDGEEFTFPAGAIAAGTYIYVASEQSGFSSFFGFSPDFTTGAASINGDDAIELFFNDAVVDVFGDINVDGTGQPWEYLDGWVYRADGTGPDGTTFVPGNWSYSGPNALDGETSNATAAVPFPLGSYASCSPTEPTPAAPELLLTEIVVTPTGGEFIEIYNPTGGTIDLSNVYLTDATFANGGVFYYNVVTGANAGGGGFGDFHARFPDGATIAAGEYQVIAIAGSADFSAAYGIDPDYELYEDGAAADSIADMREALAGSINNQGGLTNTGEVVVLYAWDGETDLVQDIDYVVWGDKAEAVDKTGVSIDGPDADADPSMYADDTATAAQEAAAPGHPGGDSFQRIDLAEGTETQSGGNGISGSDETSENLSETWNIQEVTPGAPSVQPQPDLDWIINEIHADPAFPLGDANGDGTRDTTDDEFVEIVNVSGGPVDISGWTLSDGFTVRHVFPNGSVIPDNCSVVVFGGGNPAGAFGNGTVQTASTGSLGLNNSGDTVSLNDGVQDLASVSYGGEGGNDQSLTLDPDLDTSQPYVLHSSATGSEGALFSPGTRTDGRAFDGCPSPWVINEIHADPASPDGDANGDGTRDSTDDEFVEIVNRTGADVDISGWTLADGFSLRHEFPAGSVVLDGCSVVVFGGGTPTGSFGNSLVQTASTGALGLNNGGDSVSLSNGAELISDASYGSAGGDNQSLTLDPDVTGALPRVKHSVATGSGGTLFSPGTKIDGTQHDGCPLSTNVSNVQGPGDTSPLLGNRVIITGVVTAVSPDGFFIQTAGDGDPNTSDGVFVFTGDAPEVAVGDEVEVNGFVDEFFGFTEITGPIVSVLGTGTIPDAIVFDATVPSPDPNAPSCDLEFECYEGMLVEIPEGTVTASNQRFRPDPIAEVFITSAPSRSFREPGIEFPGIPGYPVFDGNPEVFELDPDKLGLPNRIIPAGSTFSATGVIGFEFGGYELWPTELSVDEAPLPRAVREATRDEATIASLNLFRLFDDFDDPPSTNATGRERDDTVIDPDEYALRRAKLASHIVDVLRSPDILAVQEAEKLGVLEDLAASIAVLDPSAGYEAYLVEGNDVGTIDVGFLVKKRVKVRSVTQLAADELFMFEDEVSPLHDRPPLLLDAVLSEDLRVKVLAVHMRSLSRIETPRVQRKRLEQAQSIARLVEDIQKKRNVKLVVAGDFNAFEFTDGYVDVAGIIAGDFNPTESLACESAPCPDLVARDLENQVTTIDPNDRYSFVFRGNAQILDQALTSRKLSKLVTGLEFARGNSDAAAILVEDAGVEAELPVRASDHDGLVLYVCKDDDDCEEDDDGSDDDSSDDDSSD